MQGPLVTIIVPMYNAEHSISRCIETIVGQTYSYFELILIDDGSEDSTEQICRSYSDNDNRIKYIKQENQGPSSARNHGIRIASGDAIAFVDSDDYISESYISALVEGMEATKADLVVCGHSIFTDDDLPYMGKCDGNVTYRTYERDEYLAIFFKVKGNETVYYPWGKLYRRSTIEDKQFPDDIYHGEDVLSTLKAISKANSIAVTDEKLYCYCNNKESITGAAFDEGFLQLYDVWDQAVIYAEACLSGRMAYYAKINRMRVDFTLLCDMAKAGNASSDNIYAMQRRNAIRGLRANLLTLLASPFAVHRKCAMAFLAVFGSPVITLPHRGAEIAARMNRILRFRSKEVS